MPELGQVSGPKESGRSLFHGSESAGDLPQTVKPSEETSELLRRFKLCLGENEEQFGFAGFLAVDAGDA
jgi:hypothetical protein